MAAFNTGGLRTDAKYNFVSAFDIHKPDVDPELALRYGSQSLTGLMYYTGNVKETHALEYVHHEEDWIMPKVKATQAASPAAGAVATYTLDATSDDTVTAQSPYVTAGTPETIVPIRLNDIILLKPASGVVGVSNYIRAFVTEVTTTTFKAIPTDVLDTLPTYASATEIVILSNAHGEGSGQPKSLSSRTLKFTNQLQIFKETMSITGTEENIMLWVDVEDEDGNKAPYYMLKGENDTWRRFENFKELGLLMGEKITNTAITDVQFAADTPITSTEGLIPFILGNGITSNYSGITGFTLADHETLIKELDKQKGSKQNLFECGIELSGQLDRELGDRFTAGAISYGNFNFDDAKRVSLEFDTYSIMGYTFHKKTYDAFNDLQTLGAAGYTFPKDGMILPMDNRTLIDNGERMSVPSLRVRYLKDRAMKVSFNDLFEVDGTDKIEIRYLSQSGFEGTAGNRFAYVKQA